MIPLIGDRAAGLWVGSAFLSAAHFCRQRIFVGSAFLSAAHFLSLHFLSL
jgi:hypothetical protein